MNPLADLGVDIVNETERDVDRESTSTSKVRLTRDDLVSPTAQPMQC